MSEALARLEYWRELLGRPLVVSPTMAARLRNLGLVEGEHFTVSKYIPATYADG